MIKVIWLEKIAKHNYKLDVLINDSSSEVRKAVAEQGYGLDILINDKHWAVRLAVAEQGYGLDQLINDEHAEVRAEVAKQGYGLDKLINDERAEVRFIANDLYNAKVYLVERNCGNYKGNLYLYIFYDNEYEIISDCYETNSLERWKEKCTEQLDGKQQISIMKK